MADNDLVPIGELARRMGVATSALRYYERIGLLSAAERYGQQRHYPPASVERVALIRLCQDAGFTLAEISQFIPAARRGQRQVWADLAERKLVELDARIADAQQAKELVQHALGCRHRDLLACPNFHSALDAHVAASSHEHR